MRLCVAATGIPALFQGPVRSPDTSQTSGEPARLVIHSRMQPYCLCARA